MTCVFVTGAAFISDIQGAVDISDSAFSDNQAQSASGGRIISLDNDNDNDNDTCIYMCVHTLKECKQNGLLMLLLLLSLYCMTCVLMTYMTGALFIAVVAGDVSIRSGSNFTANTAPNGGMFR